MELWRARIEAENTPGQLAEIASALARVGANIVSLDVHATGASRVADDLVVAVSEPVDADAFGHLLAPLDARLIDLRPADAHELVDPVTRALDAAGRVVREEPSCQALAAAIAQVVAVEVAFVRPVVDGLPVTGVAARALAEGRAVLGCEPVKSLPAGSEGTWVLAAPATIDGEPAVAVAVRRSPRFSFTETARLQAVVGAGRAASGAPRPDPGTGARVVLGDGGEIHLRPLLASDEGALVRLHGRCSPTTVRRRYFTALRTLPTALLSLLMDVDGDRRIAMVAAVGSELVGVAHLHVPPGGAGEVAVLVEDAHQRRGIGATLLHSCMDAAAARGAHTLTAVCLADNTAFPGLVASCGYTTASTLADGIRQLTFPVPTQSELATAGVVAYG